MASGMLMGAGLGAATSMATGQDPLKGAAIGGAMGGIGGAMSSAPTTGAAASQQFAEAGFVNPALTSGAGTGAYSGATSMMTNPALTESPSMFGGLGDAVSSGFDSFKDTTGLTNRDMTMMGVNQGLSAMQPTPQQQIQHAPVNVSRPQVDLSQGVSPMSSNPRLKRLKMEGLL